MPCVIDRSFLFTFFTNKKQSFKTSLLSFYKVINANCNDFKQFSWTFNIFSLFYKLFSYSIYPSVLYFETVKGTGIEGNSFNEFMLRNYLSFWTDDFGLLFLSFRSSSFFIIGL